MQSCWLKRTREIALGSACVVALLAASMPASVRAQDDSEERGGVFAIERQVWDGIVHGLGLRSPNDPMIEYRERSPLVVPPSRDLPPPQAKAIPRDPSWPVDPERARAKLRAQTKRTVGNDTSRILDERDRPLTPAELDPAGARRGAPATTGTGSNAPSAADDRPPVPAAEAGWSLFSGRAWGFGAYQNEVGTFTNEPPRTALTAPPSGYQTPSAAEPYGMTKRIERAKVKQFDPAGRE